MAQKGEVSARAALEGRLYTLIAQRQVGSQGDHAPFHRSVSLLVRCIEQPTIKDATRMIRISKIIGETAQNCARVRHPGVEE